MNALPDFKQEAHTLFDELVRVRRDLHQYPELGFQEHRTSNLVAETLQQLGYEVQRGIAQTGVIGLLEGNQPGPTIMLRFDMDALPIQEQSQVSYASKTSGVMHACGHDGHVSMGLGLARILAKYQNQLTGTVKLVFQPAEEGLGGAFAMIADGVLEDPRPDVVFAMHLWTGVPYGQVRTAVGPTMAASSVFTLTVQGKGGHGAAPHESIDPILAAAHIVTALQSIVSRNVDPQESVVVTVGQMTAGTTFNVIPDHAVLKGTVRSYNNEIHHIIYRRILEMARNMSTAFRCSASMETVAIVPAVVNSPEPTDVVNTAARRIVGRENLVHGREMASEDMGYVLEEIPGCYFFIGARNEEKGLMFPHHHPQFDFDERAMINGVATMAYAAAHYLMNSHDSTQV
ncbi:MAG: amidohydrolase [Chloroflexi bacterium]|nr:amidohydrolase [Chloroflexota bacterium]MBP8056615.1 amidohydrolase [Chloroflexota bacterium]